MSQIEKSELENREEPLDENEDLKQEFTKLWMETNMNHFSSIQNIIGPFHEAPEKKKYPSLLEQPEFGMEPAHPNFGYSTDMLFSPLQSKFLTPSNQNMAKGLSPFNDYNAKLEPQYYFKPQAGYNRAGFEYDTPSHQMSYYGHQEVDVMNNMKYEGGYPLFEDESLSLMWGTAGNHQNHPHLGNAHYHSVHHQSMSVHGGAPSHNLQIPAGNYIVTPLNGSGSIGYYRSPHFQTPEKNLGNLKKREYFPEDVKLEPSPQTVEKYSGNAHYKTMQEHQVMSTEREDYGRDSNDSSEAANPSNKGKAVKEIAYENLKREHSEGERLSLSTPRNHNSGSSNKIGELSGKRSKLKDFHKQMANFHSQKKLKTDFPTPTQNQKKRNLKDFDHYPTPKSQYSFYSTENSDRENDDTTNRKSRGLRVLSSKVKEIVCEKKQKTYKEVAEELINELDLKTKSKLPGDEKNVKRRVYDALNVLIASDVLKKKGKLVYSDETSTLIGNSFQKTKKQEKMHLEASLAQKKEILKKKREILQELILKKAAIDQLMKRNKIIMNTKAEDIQASLFPNSIVPIQDLKKACDQAEFIMFPFIVIEFPHKKGLSLKMSKNQKCFKVAAQSPMNIFGDVDILLKLGFHQHYDYKNNMPKEVQKYIQNTF